MTEQCDFDRLLVKKSALTTLVSHGRSSFAREYAARTNQLGKVKQWQSILSLLGETRAAGLQADVIPYNAAISACGRGQQWKRALALL